MYKLESHQRSSVALHGVCLLCFVCFFWVAPTVAESLAPARANPTASKNFTISTNDGLVSVKATEASLKDIIERIGQELGVEVEAQIGGQEKVTAEFQDLTLDQALEHLSGNYAYTTDSDGEKISKLFIYPKGKARSAVSENDAGGPASSPGSFRFEFDPSEF